mgnify:FL=1|nr:MAG TPA: hypothetical protein [Caudoviricetes sp.]
MNAIDLSEEKARVFAYWYLLLQDPQEAARRAQVEDGVLLLFDRRVKKELRRMQKAFAKQGAGELAKLALYRILFERPKQDAEGVPAFDGFTAERFSAGKEIEFKGWDKLKACELMMKLAEKESAEDSRFGGVLEALQQGAQELEDWKEEDAG